MLSLKKTSLIFVLSSSTALAGTMGPVCTEGNVTIPCTNSGWEFGGQALYLNPNYGIPGLTETSTVTPVPGDPTTNNVSSIINTSNSTWDWGFKLEGAYHFNSGRDLNLNWYHYNNTANQTLMQGPSPQSVIDENIGSAAFYSNVALRLKTQWDAVNIELGQRLNFMDQIKTRLHGGFQYANIRLNVAESAISSGTGAMAGSAYDATSGADQLTYSGFGPRIGADFMYGWDNGFALYAKAASALLMGTQHFKTSAYSVSNSLNLSLNGVPIGTPSYTIESSVSTQITLDVDTKVGATYTYTMTNANLSFDAGWMWNKYIDTFLYVRSFGVQGPYVGLKWVG